MDLWGLKCTQYVMKEWMHTVERNGSIMHAIYTTKTLFQESCANELLAERDSTRKSEVAYVAFC